MQLLLDPMSRWSGSERTGGRRAGRPAGPEEAAEPQEVCPRGLRAEGGHGAAEGDGAWQ